MAVLVVLLPAPLGVLVVLLPAPLGVLVLLPSLPVSALLPFRPPRSLPASSRRRFLQAAAKGSGVRSSGEGGGKVVAKGESVAEPEKAGDEVTF